ncbi:MAG: N-acetyltransferase family protein [Pseudomonadota bacterium]
MIMRAAEPSDAAAIAAIWNPYIRDTAITFTTEEKSTTGLADLIRDRTNDGYPFLAADEGGALSGFASFAPFRSGPGYRRTMEHTVMLAPAACGRGVGRALMAALEECARASGHRSLIGALSSANSGAIAFHAALGFAQVGSIPQAGWKFDRWWDLILMQKQV